MIESFIYMIGQMSSMLLKTDGREIFNFPCKFSISRPSFVLQQELLFRSRKDSSCGLIRGNDGLPVEVIIGGQEKGMEVWNPRKQEVQLLWDENPFEVGGSLGLRFAQLIPINGGSELIVYGGYNRGYIKNEIWKYTTETNSWTKYFKCLALIT